MADAGCASSRGASKANKVPGLRLGRWLLACITIALCVATTALAASAPTQSPGVDSGASAATRYSLANGCFGLRAVSRDRFVAKETDSYRASARTAEGAARFYMKATRLGSYLLYDSDRQLLAADADGRVVPAERASEAADWEVRESGGSFTLENRQAEKSLAVNKSGRVVLASDPTVFSFEETTGCSAYPEIEVNAEGPIRTGSNENGEVSGLVDAHMHHMAFEFLGGKAHCGRPWHPYGPPQALIDCPDHQPNGAGAVLENTVSYGNPVGTHNTDGWPTFAGWPHHASLTHEQSYYKWLERSWRGGLRVFVNLLVENEVLCKAYPLKSEHAVRTGCNEMASARLQAERMRELEDYIDAQNGGPGKGWYRIVRTPAEARQVIEQGKLAVVMGMETSKPFNCGRFNDQPTCTKQEIDRQIDAFHNLGVSQLELVNKFDNGFTGVAGDSGTNGAATNTGNFADTGEFFDLGRCEDPRFHDHTPTALHTPSGQTEEDDHGHNEDALIANGLRAFPPPETGGKLPVYPPPPNCNRLRLSDLGRHALDRIMANGMIFDPDHMGVYARQDSLTVLEEKGYPGIISSHSWSTEDATPRIYALGGMVTPYAGNSEDFVAKWRRIRAIRASQTDNNYYFGFGYGADMNGFGSQGGPTNSVTYPFQSYDGTVTFHKQRSGTRTYDINEDGVAHYGLYPDWIEDARKVAGTEGETLMQEMGRGAEAYLKTWERARSFAQR
jgi:microsomal dipeptidase-like Zn-dependent dipeptidase